MPLKKIGDLPSVCRHPEHDPPSHIVLDPGIYEHTCPGCGHKITFTVSRPICQHNSSTTLTDFPKDSRKVAMRTL